MSLKITIKARRLQRSSKRFRRCAEKGIKTTVDPKFRNFDRYRHVDLFKPNLKEMREGLSMAIHKESDASLAQAVQRMHERLDASISMVTLSERGVCFYAPDHSQAQRIPAFEREITDVSGAAMRSLL